MSLSVVEQPEICKKWIAGLTASQNVPMTVHATHLAAESLTAYFNQAWQLIDVQRGTPPHHCLDRLSKDFPGAVEVSGQLGAV